MKNMFIIFCFLHAGMFAQHAKIDSLLRLVKADKEDTLKVIHEYGLCREYSKIGEYDKGLEHGKDALALALNLNFKKGIAQSYNNIGVIYWYQGNYPSALKRHFAALEVREEIKDLKGIAQSYNNIGLVYKEQGALADALKNYTSALVIFTTLKDQYSIATCYSNIGIIQKSQFHFAEALKNYGASLEIRKVLGDKWGIAQSYNNIGNVYTNEGDYAKGLENYKAALELREAIGDQEGISVSCVNLGTLYIRMNKLDDSEHFLKRALELSKSIGSKEWIKESYEAFSILDSSRGNYKESLIHYKLYSLYRDSLNNEESKKKSIQSAMQYEFDKKEIENKAEQETIKTQATAEQHRQKVITNAVIGLLLIVLLFSFFFYKRFRHARKQKQTIELLFKEVHHRVKNNMQVITSLLNLQKGYLRDPHVLSIFQDCQNRIFAMAAIHEKLYERNALSDINIKEYIENLITQLMDTYQRDNEVESDPVVETETLQIDTLITLGLITNEVVSNAFKYAFPEPGRKNRITFKLTSAGPNAFLLLIGDNGIGSTVALEDEHTSFGMELIKILVSQLRGNITRLPVQGTLYEIRFTT
ncbi:MAG TPA: tetratricopeptide repeat protein [Bacteroidia bacterium]|nr:tetratricopeptide repeat protein [Bacteroidia bacterium]